MIILIASSSFRYIAFLHIFLQTVYLTIYIFECKLFLKHDLN